MSECRTCGARIIWAVTTKGKRMPLDYDPKTWEEGDTLFRLGTELGGNPTAEYVPGYDGLEAYVSHFATCPDAQKHRRSP